MYSSNREANSYLRVYLGHVTAMVILFIFLNLAKPEDVEGIVSGKVANVGQWPFYAWSRTSSRNCGAVIINSRSVLTLASCIKGFSPKGVTITIGSVIRNEGIKHEVTHSCAATAYDQATAKKGESFVLLRLAKTIKFDANINKVRFDEQNSWNMTYWNKCYAIGAGYYDNLILSRDLRYNEIRLHQCVGESRDFVFCFRHLGPVAGVSCEGDSGGPVVCEKDKSIWLIGLVSGVSQQCYPYSASLGLTEVYDFQKFLNTSFYDCIKWFDSMDKKKIK